jgi:hypothetical protein
MKTNILSSATLTLALLAAAGVSRVQAAPWTFGVVSDTQWVVTDDGYNPNSSAVQIVRGVNKEFIRKGVSVVIDVGDLMDSSTPSSNAVRSLYAQDLYNAGIGFYPLRGNHDSGLSMSGTTSSSVGGIYSVTGTTTLASGTWEPFLYPQIINGGYNNLPPSIITPSYIQTVLWSNTNNTGIDSGYGTTYSSLLSELTTGANAPIAQSGTTPFVTGSNFSYPATNCTAAFGANVTGTNLSGANNGKGGVSYSFDYAPSNSDAGVRFILADQFVDSSLGGNDSSLAFQQSWINTLLTGTAGAARPLHTFFFSHKQLLGGNHKDNLFGNTVNGSDPGDGCPLSGSTGSTFTGTALSQLKVKQAWEDAFISAMSSGSAHFVITGHDHHHQESIVKSPLNPAASVRQIITASDSDKFYTPGSPFSVSQVPVNEDLYEIGYYLFTVDGPRVTVDYFAVPSNGNGANIPTTPVLDGNWVKVTTTGYSQNGQEFQVTQGSSYTAVQDNTNKAVQNPSVYGETGYVGTSLAILGGTNNSTLKTHDGRHLVRVVDTGWAPQSNDTTGAVLSDIATIWGLTDTFSIQTDTVAISLALPPSVNAASSQAQAGAYCLGARDRLTGAWVNAVDYNIVGGSKNFVYGAYSSAYGLGTWGIDPVAGTAWAVVNGDARDYAVINTPTAPLPWAFAGTAGHVGKADLTVLVRHLGSTATSTANGVTYLTYDLNGDGKVDVSDEKWLASHFTNPGGN